MAVYRDRIFPRIMNVLMNTKETRRIRSEVCAPLAGQVVELGFGTGLNLPHLPSAVTELQAVDPMKRGRHLAAGRLAASSVPVRFVGLDGEDIPLPDGSVDAVLSTWTLCSIADPVRAVREVRRILRPGGRFHFAEHGRSPEPEVQRMQDRLNPIQRRVACGCHLNRDIPSVITDGGMRIDDLETFYARGDPKAIGWTFRGTASAA